jgi:hypothetical protein
MGAPGISVRAGAGEIISPLSIASVFKKLHSRPKARLQ